MPSLTGQTTTSTVAFKDHYRITNPNARKPGDFRAASNKRSAGAVAGLFDDEDEDDNSRLSQESQRTLIDAPLSPPLEASKASWDGGKYKHHGAKKLAGTTLVLPKPTSFTQATGDIVPGPRVENFIPHLITVNSELDDLTLLASVSPPPMAQEELEQLSTDDIHDRLALHGKSLLALKLAQHMQVASSQMIAHVLNEKDDIFGEGIQILQNLKRLSPEQYEAANAALEDWDHVFEREWRAIGDEILFPGTLDEPGYSP